MREEVNIYSK